MSRYIKKSLRDAVRARDKERCTYCLSPDDLLGLPCELDHIVPVARGGQNEIDNLCLACSGCNRSKGSRIEAVLESGEVVRFFHPVRDKWDEHFEWVDDGRIIQGITDIGKVTVHALQLNREHLVRARQSWIRLGVHPPK